MATRKGTTGKEVINYDERLAALAEESAGMEARVGGGGSYISIRGGNFTFREEILGNPFQCVVLEHCLDNAYYVGGFDPDNPSSPVCFAVARGAEEDLAPHEDAPEPQSELCIDCPQNEWGTADTGRGKACKNGRRLALLHMDDLENGGVEEAEVAMLRVPPTSLKYWASYVKKLTRTMKLPPLAVVTEMELVMDSEYPEIKFSFVGAVEGKEQIAALLAKRDEIIEDLTMPYDLTNYIPPEERNKPKRRGPANKARSAGGKARRSAR